MFLLVVIASTWFFGPLGLIVFAVVVGGALVVTGARSSGWPRPVLIVPGAVLVAAILLFVVDFATGWWQISVR